MLVNRRHEAGSTLVTVLASMLVLSLLALTMAAVVTNTTHSVVTTRNTAESRAAADAGMAALVAKARQSPGAFCRIAIDSTAAPVYEAESGDCAAGKVTFTSTGHGSGGAATTIEAVYGYTEPSAPGGAGDMVFFGNTTFTAEVKTYSLDDDLLSIVIPTGDFTCQAPIPGNILLSGNFFTKGGCKVAGGVAAGGYMDMSNGPDQIVGSVTMAGSGKNIVRGTIGGTLRTGGSIEFGWEGKKVNGNVETSGDAQLGNVRIEGSLTVPASKTVTMQSGAVVGGISRPSSMTSPPAPTFDSWFDYAYKASDWPGFVVKTLVNSGNGPGTCNYFSQNDPQNSNAAGWRELADLVSPTILDARACGTLTSNNGSHPVVSVRTDIVFLAKSYNLTRLTIKGATGSSPRLWFIVEDLTANATPTCKSGGNISINGTVISDNVTAMAYTPCVVDVQGQVVDSWRGAFYGGSFNYGGGLSFYGDPIALPGQPTGGGPGGGGAAGAKVLTAVISQRDKR